MISLRVLSLFLLTIFFFSVTNSKVLAKENSTSGERSDIEKVYNDSEDDSEEDSEEEEEEEEEDQDDEEEEE
jgi:hypothetical protein